MAATLEFGGTGLFDQFPPATLVEIMLGLETKDRPRAGEK